MSERPAFASRVPQLWGMVLRRRQVELVRECVDVVETNRSAVKQMIMGAGKTTVVSPLICLMLAHGDFLVIQCVPAALLPMSQSIMRTTFSSAILKRVYSFACERATPASRALLKKLENAKAMGAVVGTTPQAIKSLLLNFVECVVIKTSPADKEFDSEERSTATEIWREILKLFAAGVAIMDEVDWVLHPLKSELNFPVGEKTRLDYTDQGERWRLPMAALDVVLYTAERYQALADASGTSKAIPERLQLGVAADAVAHIDMMIHVIGVGFAEKAFQKSPGDRAGFVLLQDSFYTKEVALPNGKGSTSFRELMATFMVNYIRRLGIASPSDDCPKGMTDAQILEYIKKRPPPSDACACDDRLVRDLARAAESCSGDEIKLLNLAFEWLNTYLPHALKKIDRVTFGLLSEQDLAHAFKVDPMMSPTRKKLAVPFISKDVPAPASEFAQPDVVIGLSFLGYRYEGMRFGDFLEAMDRLQQTFHQEGGPKEKRPSNERYREWIDLALGAKGDRRVPRFDKDRGFVRGDPVLQLPLNLLDRTDESHMRPLFMLLGTSPEFIFWYLNDLTFPSLMLFQNVKLSASGQDMGSNILFKRRIGFSGTPSDLLPRELGSEDGGRTPGRCQFEEGSEGAILDTLVAHEVVSCKLLDDKWNPRSVLRAIALGAHGELGETFHALIDTGALVTGFSNVEVARFLLGLSGGVADDEIFLDGFEGVVYLNEQDEKMIWNRDMNCAMRLEECSILKEKRFAFYDQIHTTGMDIKHRLRARAALTLGKDMAWRDYAQGAYRMRGIAKGQSIVLLVSPEVKQLIRADIRHVVDEAALDSALEVNTLPRWVAAWQLLQQVRSELLQFAMLQFQNLANVWRTPAFNALLDGYHFALQGRNPHVEGGLDLDDPLRVVTHALHAFLEDVGMAVTAVVPAHQTIDDIFAERTGKHEQWVTTELQKHIVAALTREMAGTSKASEHDCATERELQKEEERELEQETEMERYVQMAYKRDDEAPVPWAFDELRHTNGPASFYPASKFRLFNQPPLVMPQHGAAQAPHQQPPREDLYFSSNYFNLKWSGQRRLRNIMIIMEWLPSAKLVKPSVELLEPGTSEQRRELSRIIDRIWQLLAQEPAEGRIDRDAVQLVLEESLGRGLDDATMESYFAMLAGDSGDSDEAGAGAARLMELDRQQLRQLLLDPRHRPSEDGRRSVCLSLSEAQTIRRILHVRQGRDAIDGWSTTLALRGIARSTAESEEEEDGDDAASQAAIASLLDASKEYYRGPTHQASMVNQACRFFDGDTQFEPNELQQLLRVLQGNSTRARQEGFSRMSACRRRFMTGQGYKWQDKPIATVLRDLPDEWRLLRQRVEGRALELAIEYAGRTSKAVDTPTDLTSFFQKWAGDDKQLDGSEIYQGMLSVGLMCSSMSVGSQTQGVRACLNNV